MAHKASQTTCVPKSSTLGVLDEQGKRKEGASQRRDQRGDTYDNGGGGAMCPSLPV